MKQTLLVSAVLLVFLAHSLEVTSDTIDINKLNNEQKRALEILDKIDIDEELKDKALIDKRLACVLKEDTCDGDEVFESINVLIPLGLKATGCKGCSGKQRGKMIKTAKFIKYNLRERYDQLLQKFNDGVEPPELEAI